MRAISNWFMVGSFVGYAYLLFVVLNHPFSTIETLSSSPIGFIFVFHQLAISSAIEGHSSPLDVELTALKLFSWAFYVPFTLILVVMWRLRARIFHLAAIPKDVGRVALFVVISMSISFSVLFNPSYALFGIGNSTPKPWGIAMFLVLSFFAGFMQIMAVEFIIRYLRLYKNERRDSQQK